jgi:hypothetical protein
MPLLETRGAGSAKAFGLTASTTAAVYIEDVFSCFLYTGNGSTQTITNGIDLSGKGGLVWLKHRSAASSQRLYDTARGANNAIFSNLTNAQTTIADSLNSFNSDGFTIGTANSQSGATTVGWTFRKQPKFFDVVTWTGNNADGRFISHNLGSTPGMVIIKNTTSTYNWVVWHRSLANPSKFLVLNSTAATATDIYGPFGSYDGGFTTNAACFTSTGFYVAADARSNLNANNYVAYLFAHDAGGFGLTGTDNVISCGSVTGGQVVNLGYEPQLVISKCSASTGDWSIVDNMRGAPTPASGNTPYSNVLVPNTADAETTSGLTGSSVIFNSTGFRLNPDTVVATTYIYIAIRRGPMKTPTTGTSVFSPSTVGASNNITVGFPADTAWFRYTGSDNWRCFDRLRSGFELATNLTGAEGTYNYYPTYIDWDSNSVWYQNLQNGPVVDYFFRRAPGFFDVVCYTGNGDTSQTVNHNLGVQPELMILKCRNTSNDGGWAGGNGSIWPVVVRLANGNGVWFTNPGTSQVGLNTAAASNYTDNYFANTQATATSFQPWGITLSSSATPNGVTSGNTYVAYLFASCPGVSKVFSYTGNGTSQTINCGFAAGARFVMVKRTDSTGNWLVVDTARGLVSAGDPTLYLNSTAAEVTGVDWIDPDSSGFIVNQESTMNANVNGATYIGLAIA